MARSRGFAFLVVLILLAVILSLSVTLLDVTLSTRRAGKTVAAEGAALRLAHAGVSKAVFCLNAQAGVNCGGVVGPSYPGESNVGLAEGSFTSTVTAVNPSTRDIAAIGIPASGGRPETVLISATTDPPVDKGIAFGSAAIAGAGGAYLYGTGAAVTGDVHSVSDVRCSESSNHVYGDLHVSKDGGYVAGCSLHGDAHADMVLESLAHRDVYYRGWFGDLFGTSVDGQKHPGSARSASLPLPSVDLAFWRREASAGGMIAGDYAPADGSSLGPTKIDGDLTLNPGVDVTLNGTVWVTGNIIMYDSSSLSLSPAMGPFGTVVLADNEASPGTKGKIDLRNNAVINGSGHVHSFVLFVSTNTSVDYENPAIKVDASSARAAYVAPNGVVRLTSYDTAAALAGWRVYVNSYAAVNFTGSGLAEAKFGSYPPGKWRTLSGTYRER